MHILYSFLLAIFFYIAIIISYKLMGKREISELSIFDFVMNLIIADVVATGIVEEKYWLDSLAGLVALILLQVIMARILIKKSSWRKFVNAEPSLIIQNGKIDYEELSKLRIQLDELMMLLRQDNVTSIENVQYAIMEATGKVSVFENNKPSKVFPLPLIISGTIKEDLLPKVDLTKDWLLTQLNAHQIELTLDLKYLFYEKDRDGASIILHTKSDISRIPVITPEG